MSADTWKQFEQNAVSHSVAHHLMTIAALRDQQGYARVSDVAKALQITRGAASLNLKALKQRGLVLEDDNRFLRLSPAGDALAHAVRAKNVVLERFFEQVLGLSTEEAVVNACKVEHLVSDEAAQRLSDLVCFIEAEAASPVVKAFTEAFSRWKRPCEHGSRPCAWCDDGCAFGVPAKT